MRRVIDPRGSPTSRQLRYLQFLSGLERGEKSHIRPKKGAASCALIHLQLYIPALYLLDMRLEKIVLGMHLPVRLQTLSASFLAPFRLWDPEPHWRVGLPLRKAELNQLYFWPKPYSFYLDFPCFLCESSCFCASEESRTRNSFIQVQPQDYIFFLRQQNMLPTGPYAVQGSKWHCKTPDILIACLLDLPGIAWVVCRSESFCLCMVFRHRPAYG